MRLHPKRERTESPNPFGKFQSRSLIGITADLFLENADPDSDVEIETETEVTDDDCNRKSRSLSRWLVLTYMHSQ